MPDTPRLLPALQALLPDNIIGSISAQDVRDALVSTYPIEFNVKNYGALGDDATNDTAAIQAAIDAANAAGGGTVRFGEGTFQTNKLTLYTAVSLRGDGPHATILKLRASQNTALLTTNGFVTTDAAAGIHSFTIEDMTFDGNKANQTSNGDSGCVQLYGYNYLLRNVHIRNGESVGLYCNWGTAAGAPGPNGISMESHFDGLKVYTNGTDGIYFNGPHDSTWVGCIAYENGGKGFGFEARGNSCQLTNCHSWGASQTYAYYLNSTNIALNECQGEGASAALVEFRGNDSRVVGGSYFFAPAVAFNLGAAVGGLFVATKVLGATTAALALGANDAGGNYFELLYYAATGAPFTGTRHASTTIISVTTGGATAKPAIFAQGLTIDGAALALKDGISAPGTETGFALIYVDTGTGDLMVKFGDGVTKTLATDT